MDSEVEVTSCSKDKRKKTCFLMERFYNHKWVLWDKILISQKMKAESRVMMAKL